MQGKLEDDFYVHGEEGGQEGGCGPGASQPMPVAESSGFGQDEGGLWQPG